MPSPTTVEVDAVILRDVAHSFLAQNQVMTRRVTTLSFIIGGLLVGGALWYIGLLDRWIPLTTSTGLEATISDLVRRLGAVIMMIFLVRIFVPLLRYAAELEIFYRSRAAALQLLAAGTDDRKVRVGIQTLVDLVSSDKVRLDLAPESPVAELIATVRPLAKEPRDKLPENQ